MVIQSVHGDVEVEAEEATPANPGEVQVRVQDKHCKTMDLKRMTTFNKFVPFTRHTASMHHTFKDTKEAFICAIPLKLGEYAQDVRKAVQDKLPHVFTVPTRGQATPTRLQMQVRPVPAGEVLTRAEQNAKQQYQVNLIAYTAEEECVRFEQGTFDMQFKAAFADHKGSVC